MSEAPERIWMDPDIKFPECEKQYGCDVEYVRADRIAELEAENEKLTGALVSMLHRWEMYCGGPDNPYGGQTDAELMALARAALGKE